jgi:hypothetical protein
MARIPVTIQTSQPVGSTNPAAVLANGRSIAAVNLPGIGPAQPQEQTPNRAANRLQSAANQAYRQAAARYDAAQFVIPQVAFVANTQQAVPHRLGRAWVGCVLMTPIGGALSYEVAHAADPRLDAAQILVTTTNNLKADVCVW